MAFWKVALPIGLDLESTDMSATKYVADALNVALPSGWLEAPSSRCPGRAPHKYSHHQDPYGEQTSESCEQVIRS